MLTNTNNFLPKTISNREFFSSLKRLFSYFSGYRWVFFVLFIICLFEACLITAGSYFIGLLYNDFLMKQTQDIFHWQNFLGLCLVMFILRIIPQVSFLLHTIWISKISEHVMYCLRQKTLKKLHLLPVDYFNKMSSGEIMSIMSNDIDNISLLTSHYLSSIFFYASLVLVNIVVMFLINWFLACVTMLCVPLMIVVNYVIVKKTQSHYYKQQEGISKLNGFSEEMVSGIKIISLFKMQEKIVGSFDKINRDLTKNSLVAQTSSNMMIPLNNFLTRLCMFVICALGLSLIIFFGFQSPTGKILSQSSVFPNQFMVMALLAVFTTFATNFTEAFNAIISSFSFVFYALAGSKRLFKILDECEEKDSSNSKKLNNLIGKVEAKNLCFGYEENKLILKKLNFLVSPGQTVAIVGPTGAGKTTIANLITKFYEISSGQLLIDDQSIQKINRYFLRQKITVVLQESFLFAVSIKENIRYGRLDATDQEIIQVAKEANLHDFIMHLPKKYETILQDNGADLSIGQKQLLTIARALLAKPKILILDEATSSIDTKTELIVNQAMDKLMRKKTCFVIAHRLSTIVNADNILVLKDGQIVETGNHKELIAKKGFYHHLYNIQFKKGQTI